jgi:hypothetical protein
MPDPITTEAALRMGDAELNRAVADALGLIYHVPAGGTVWVDRDDGTPEASSEAFSPVRRPEDCADVERWLLARNITILTNVSLAHVWVGWLLPGMSAVKYVGVDDAPDPIAARCRCICSIAVSIASSAKLSA